MLFLHLLTFPDKIGQSSRHKNKYNAAYSSVRRVCQTTSSFNVITHFWNFPEVVFFFFLILIARVSLNPPWYCAESVVKDESSLKFCIEKRLPWTFSGGFQFWPWCTETFPRIPGFYAIIYAVDIWKWAVLHCDGFLKFIYLFTNCHFPT